MCRRVLRARRCRRIRRVAAGHAAHTVSIRRFTGISTYREPGRINLNTLYSHNVWQRIDELLVRMRGQHRSGTCFCKADADTMRLWPANAATLVIDADLSHRVCAAIPLPHGQRLVPPTANPGQRSRTTRSTPRCLRRFAEQSDTRCSSSRQPTRYDNTTRNPYFRYQGMQRLGNLVTTRSNVYAVWITVGYFEVTPNPAGVDAQHRDGYQLGPELGIDTGEVKRHRAFYMFDRTIPVGFQRGEDLNVEKAVLLKRFIE